MIEINVENLVVHVHTQNGLAKSLIRRLKLIAILMSFKLPSFAWGRAILHALPLIRLRSSDYHK